MKIRVTKYYKDIVETEKNNEPVYFQVDTIREVDAERGKKLISSGVAEAVKERKQKNQKNTEIE